ncbi:MAG: hypothetical protein FIA92_13845 [Chloroflexi bacterium]|nr:hypothetical protein [Chloroflexota bacterium]
MRRLQVLAVVPLLCLPIAACGTTASPSPSPPPPTAAPTATPTAEPTDTAPPPVSQRFEFGAEAVVDPALAGFEAEKYINPGAVIEVDGTLHMFANTFSQWPGRVRVPHLTSDDGVTWTRDEATAALDSEDFEMADPGIDVSTGYLDDDGTWVLIFETVSSTSPWQVWRMTAAAPGGPWTVDEEPIVPVGPDGAFDSAGVTWPSVVRVGDQWALYDTGLSGSGRGTGVIGVAFSDDGITWTKDEAPVLEATESWEFSALDRPRVASTPSGLVMVYSGLDLKTRGLATSTDGRTWTKLPGPNIELSDFPLTGGAWDAALLHRNGELEYFLEIGNQPGTKIFRATLEWP